MLPLAWYTVPRKESWNEVTVLFYYYYYHYDGCCFMFVDGSLYLVRIFVFLLRCVRTYTHTLAELRITHWSRTRLQNWHDKRFFHCCLDIHTRQAFAMERTAVQLFHTASHVFGTALYVSPCSCVRVSLFYMKWFGISVDSHHICTKEVQRL